MFDDGILSIYEKLPRQTSKGGKQVDVLKLYTTSYYGEISFTAKEYYDAKQSNTKIEKKIRIPQDKSICNKHVVIMDGIRYDVGRTYSSIAKGMPITDFTLERVTTEYDIT